MWTQGRADKFPGEQHGLQTRLASATRSSRHWLPLWSLLWGLQARETHNMLPVCCRYDPFAGLAGGSYCCLMCFWLPCTSQLCFCSSWAEACSILFQFWVGAERPRRGSWLHLTNGSWMRFGVWSCNPKWLTLEPFIFFSPNKYKLRLWVKNVWIRAITCYID